MELYTEGYGAVTRFDEKWRGDHRAFEQGS
jgi:hypothetical protein